MSSSYIFVDELFILPDKDDRVWLADMFQQLALSLRYSLLRHHWMELVSFKHCYSENTFGI
jgi:hypothetical protein